METEVIFTRKTLAEMVAEGLQESISNGLLCKGSKLPSSRELACRCGVSHNVMLDSLRQLSQEGIIYLESRRRGYRVV